MTLRTGTFLCRAFGHKFIGSSEEIVKQGDGWINGDLIEVKTFRVNFCIRCGLERPTAPEITKETKSLTTDDKRNLNERD